jgi:hypothetical protein
MNVPPTKWILLAVVAVLAKCNLAAVGESGESFNWYIGAISIFLSERGHPRPEIVFPSRGGGGDDEAASPLSQKWSFNPSDDDGLLLPVSRPMIVGHRGSCGMFPEHTEISYRNAYEQGRIEGIHHIVPCFRGLCKPGMNSGMIWYKKWHRVLETQP